MKLGVVVMVSLVAIMYRYVARRIEVKRGLNKLQFKDRPTMTNRQPRFCCVVSATFPDMSY